MEMNLVLEASRRSAGGSAEARRVRGVGAIPAVVYGKGGVSETVSVEPKAIKAVLSTPWGWNNVFQLSVDGKQYPCMVKDHQFDPVRRVLTHVDFYVVDGNQMIVVDVPVEAQGTSAGVKAGGRLQITSRTVRLRCAIKDIPATVVHDVTEAGLGETIYIDAMTPPPGCTFVYRNRFPVLRIERKRGSKAEGEA